MPSFELHRPLQIPRLRRTSEDRSKTIFAMRKAMAKQQWQRAADLGHAWQKAKEKDWEITLNLAISLCQSKNGDEQELTTLASDLWAESKQNKKAKLGLANLLAKMARYEDCIELLTDQCSSKPRSKNGNTKA